MNKQWSGSFDGVESAAGTGRVIVALSIVFCALAASAAAVISAVVLVGWIVQSPSLTIPFDWSPLMVANTALCVGVLAIGLLLLLLPIRFAPVLSLVCGAGVLSLTVLTFIEWAAAMDLGIDRMITQPFTDVGQVVPGRMSPFTAITLGMLAMGVIVLSLSRIGLRTAKVVPATMAAVAASTAISVGLGYLFQYQLPFAGTMSIMTSVSVALLSVAMISAVHLHGLRAGERAKQWAAGPIVVFVMLIPILVWFGFAVKRSDVDSSEFSELAQLFSAVTIILAAVAAIAGHLAQVERERRRILQRLTAEVQALNENLEERIEKRTEALRRRQAQLRTFTQRSALDEEYARQQLTIELHDSLAQMLVTAKLSLKQLDLEETSEKSQGVIRSVADAIDHCLDRSRNLMREMSPPLLFDRGLSPAIRWLADNMESQRLIVHFSAVGQPITSYSDRDIIIYRCVRDLLYAVAHQTELAEVWLKLANRNNQLTISISEGFSEEQQRGSDDATESRIFGAREYIESIGGTFKFVPDGNATGVRVVVPIEPTPGSEKADQKPVEQVPADESSVFEPARKNGTPTVRVMLVDDHRLIRAGMRELIDLEPGLLVVAEAGNGKEAVSMLASVEPDLVIMDVHMPLMDGIAATRQMKQMHPHVHIVVVTMDDDKQTMAAAAEAGADLALSKSVVSDELCAALLAAGEQLHRQN